MKNLTKCLLFASLLLAFSFKSNGQKPGTENYLLVKRGFKIFKLGEYIDKYRNYVRLVSDGESKRYETIDENLLSVGKDIILKKIELDVKDGLITDIYVSLDRQYNESFLATLIAAYGSPDIFSSASEAFSWRTTNKSVRLTYFDKYYDEQSLAIFSNDQES